MKKIEKVSIADISFTLDSDAYVSLKQYLDALHNYYDKDPDGSEIIADIEARIAELILNEQIYTKIVSKSLIDSITAQLGTPEEIEEQADEQPAGGYAPLPDPTIPRRLYRNREGRILGGVCSGMAHFWDVNVAWIRLAFLSPMILFILTAPFDWHHVRNFTLGWSWVFIVIYVVLWFALPMAKTPRQKLESRGEKITPSSIRQNLQEGAKTPSGKKAASVMAEILAVVGRVLLFFIKLVLAVIGFTFIIASLSALVAMIIAIFNPAALGLTAVFALITGLTILSPLMLALLVMFCMTIPFFVVGTALLSLVFSWKPGRIFYWVLLGIWLFAMVFCSIVVVSNARYLREQIRNRGGVIEWFYEKNIDDNKRGIFRDFLEEEDNGLNNITITVAKDSIEVVSWRDHTGDSTYVSTDGVLKYNRRIVIRDEKAIEKAKVENGRIVVRRIDY